MGTSHLLNLLEFSKGQILELLDKSDNLKRERRSHKKLLPGRSLALLFQKASTRPESFGAP